MVKNIYLIFPIDRELSMHFVTWIMTVRRNSLYHWELAMWIGRICMRLQGTVSLLRLADFTVRFPCMPSRTGMVFIRCTHSGYQQVEWVTKNGDVLSAETILSGEIENDYKNDRSILMVGIDEEIAKD